MSMPDPIEYEPEPRSEKALPINLRRDQPLVPVDTVAGRALMAVIAILTFLAALSAGAAVLAARASDQWRGAVSNEMTIQIRPDSHRNIEEDVAKAYKTVKRELEAYGGGITDKPEIVALSQIDVLDEDELKKKSKALAKACGQTPLQLSAVANVGMLGTLRAVRDIIVQAKNSGSDD